MKKIICIFMCLMLLVLNGTVLVQPVYGEGDAVVILIPGDIDQNKLVNVGDMIALKRMIMTRICDDDPWICDVDGSGRADVSDITAVKSLILSDENTLRIFTSDYNDTLNNSYPGGYLHLP